MTARKQKRIPAPAKTQLEHLYGVLEDAQQERVLPPTSPTGTQGSPPSEQVDIDQEIIRERRIKNDDAEQDIRLKRTTLTRLFQFLTIETIIIFAFSFLQATGWFGFHLEEWSFKVLTSVTITQITVMLFAAVTYLFPKNHQK